MAGERQHARTHWITLGPNEAQHRRTHRRPISPLIRGQHLQADETTEKCRINLDLDKDRAPPAPGTGDTHPIRGRWVGCHRSIHGPCFACPYCHSAIVISRSWHAVAHASAARTSRLNGDGCGDAIGCVLYGKSCVMDSEMSLAEVAEVTKLAPAKHNNVSLLKHKTRLRWFFHSPKRSAATTAARRWMVSWAPQRIRPLLTTLLPV
jgi:hypothetical protein